MIRITDKTKCSGCSACEAVCSHGAITMTPDAMGFLYPKLDETLCCDCGLCDAVCPFHSQYDISPNMDVVDVYAVRHKDPEEVDASRSGATFIALSDLILSRGGVVYGAGYEDHFRVVHKRGETKSQRDEFRGSKYVQSDMNGALRGVRADLEEGREVLFSGTPCQTAAVRSYLKMMRVDSAKLLICDIVCHGVPSPYVWRDYLSMVEAKRGERATSVEFRDKSKLGWTAHKESFTFGGEKIYTTTYTYLFYEHIMFRHSCGACPYTNFQRPSDITLADFWGWQRVSPSFNADDRGVSLVLVNTPKGQEVFKAVEEQIDFIPSDTDSCIQPNLQRPSSVHPKREAFERDYATRGVKYVCYKYGDTALRYTLFNIMVGVVKRLKKIVKI